MNLAERLGASAARSPDRPALLFEDRSITYRELDERVRSLAAGLHGLGLRSGGAGAPGDRVGLLLGNTPAFVEAFYALAHAGLVGVPLNVGFTAEEVSRVLADAEARAVVTAPGLLPLVEEVRERLPALEEVIVAGGDEAGPGTRRLEDLVERAATAEPVALADEALALLQYTSGTTGQPKGAMLSHGNLLANQEQMAQTRLRLDEGDVVLGVLPLFHIYGLNVAMAFPLACGAAVRLVQRFDPASTLADIARHRVSFLVGVPTMYAAWLDAPEIAGADLSSVRAAISGAAPLPAAVLERWRAEHGLTVWEGYGLSETAPLLTTVAMGQEVRPGSIGRPVPGVAVRLVDERGRPISRGDPGEIVVRGPNVFAGYWRQPEATATVLDADGWFRTGDIAYAEAGDLYLVDRTTDLILVNGFNVYPREVEEILLRHPAVAAAAVIGVPEPASGEAVRAFVVPAPGAAPTAEDLLAFCARSLARFKCPQAIELLDALPQLASGKVLRRRLREHPGG